MRGMRWRGVPKDWLKRELARRSGLKCVHCGEAKTRRELTLDHIIPWSKGGKAELGNLQLLCEPCNQVKADKL